MIELRWKQKGMHQLMIGGAKPDLVLEYRFLAPSIDRKGNLCTPGHWSKWKEVSTVYEEHEHEDE